MTLEVSTQERKISIFIVKLSGSLDTSTYELLQKRIKPILIPSTKSIILDMEHLTYISSLGLGAIFGIRKFLDENKGELLITHLQPQIKRVFDIVKALPGPIFSNIEEADEYLDKIQGKTIRDE